jgi:hypothetical protein
MSLVRGPDDAAYLIAARSVVRVDLESGQAVTIATAGDGPGTGMGAPMLLSLGGPDLLILDVRGGLWRWRPSDDAGAGTLGSIRVTGDQDWSRDVPDIGTFMVNPDQGLYRLYVPHPPSNQILRYEPVGDGSGFSPPTPYFVGEGEPVETFRQLFIDGDIYAVTEPDVLKYFNGRRVTYSLDAPPDEEDLRPGHDYRLLGATGARGFGRLIVWDAMHARIVSFSKSDGSYQQQWLGGAGAPDFSDVRGMFVIDRGEIDPPLLVWASPRGVFQTILQADDDPIVVQPTPGLSPGTSPGFSPGASPGLTPPASPAPPDGTPAVSPGLSPGPDASPTDPAGQPSERPRRTPRASP